MRKIGNEFAAGVAIFLAFIIFVAGFLFLKNVALNAGAYEVIIQFPDITGLEKHDHVSVSGLRIGKVKGFRLQNLDVLVTVELDPDITLPKDSSAKIKTVGMVGEKFIDILPGKDSELLQNGDLIYGQTAGDFAEMTGTMEGLMQQAEELLIKIRSAFENVFDDGAQRDIKKSFHNIERLSSTLEENTAHLQKTMVNMDDLTTNFQEIMVDRRDKVETTIDNMHAVSGKLEELTIKLDESLTSVKSLLTKIENEEGTVGKVIARDEVYDDFRHLTAELDTLVQDLKKRPQKYLNLGFIKVF